MWIPVPWPALPFSRTLGILEVGFSEVMDEVDEAAAKMALEAVSAMQRIEKGRI